MHGLQNIAFFKKTTSIVEDLYAPLKKYLQVSTRNLKVV